MSIARVRRRRAAAVTRRAVLLLAALAVPALAARTARADAFINFDDLPNNTAVDNQYVASGVLFNGITGFPGSGAHISAGDVTPNTGSNVLASNPVALEFAQGPVTFTFTTPQQTVSLLAGYVQFNSDPSTKPGTMQAFDQNGNVVATDGPKPVNGGRASTSFAISSTSANIVKVTVATTQFAYTVIEDLRFGGGAVIPPPTGTPVVTINTPTDQTLDFANNPLRITGIVTGQGLLTTAKVTLQLLTPPPLAGFPSVNNGLIPFTVNAAGGGIDSATAGSTAAFGKLLIGTYKLTVSVTNLAGATGSASVTFTNLPSVVVNNANANQFGTFKFAEPAEGGCQMVSYSGGAIAYFSATAPVIVMANEIATKWFSVLDYSILRGNGRLGCPVAGDVFTVQGPSQVTGQILTLRTQDFVRGRIYDNHNVSTAYTPKVFVDAIKGISLVADPATPDGPALNARDPLGITEVGIPFADPTFDMFGSNPTILFQRFRRYDYKGLANTLEIRGRNPRLYFERVGGSILDFAAGVGTPPTVPNPTTQNPNPFDSTPTVWESYNCTYSPQSGQYQCPVSRPHVRQITPQQHVPIYTDAGQIDNFTAFCPDTDTTIAVEGAIGFTPVAWTGVPLKTSLPAEPSIADHTDILTKGWITTSKRSGEDLPSVHEHMHYSATGDAVTVGATVVGCVFVPIVGCVLGAAGGHQAAGAFGWCDWNFHIRPLALAGFDPNATKIRPPRNGVIGPPFWNLLAVNADPAFEDKVGMGDMEIEWEHDWWVPWVNLADNHIPQAGSLIYLNGRWILDCAHPPFHSEIHPPNSFLAMETAKPTPGMQGIDPTNPFVTRAQIWVNQLYEGQPFQTVIWPPPRPAPDAELSAFYVVYGPPQGGLMTNPDGSLKFLFTNDAVGDPAMVSPVTSVAVSGFVADGISANFSGPSGSHEVQESGQVTFPLDDNDAASGTVGDFMANYYVGWSRQ
jgi:hypothetical protein